MSSDPKTHPGAKPSAPPIEALYLHVPFCKPICPFCAFAVHGDRTDFHAPWLEAMAAEMALLALSHAQHLAGPDRSIHSVYIGGGTPSKLSLSGAGVLFSHLHQHFTLATDAEVAIELNPEDVTPAYVEGLYSLGCNRFSLGLQSLDDSTLKALGRGHDAAQSREAARVLTEFLTGTQTANLNIDLMFGAPGIPLDALREDLNTVMTWAPAHISLYGLDLEPGTLFARNRGVREWMAEHQEERVESYLWAVEALRGEGYRQYEVSNFCRPGMPGKQNLIVWAGGNYLGFGPGAHSHVNGKRSFNLRHLPTYLRAMREGKRPLAGEESLSPVQRANENLMLALRTDEGLDTKSWANALGIEWDDRRRALAERLTAEGRAVIRDDRLILTPRGFLVADEIAAALAEDHPEAFSAQREYPPE